jgi:hypothetical protein
MSNFGGRDNLQNFFGFSIIFNVKDHYFKYAIKIKIPIVFSREDIEWIKSPLDFGRKGEK